MGMVTTGVDRRGQDRQPDPTRVLVAFLEFFVQGGPGTIIRRITHDHLVINYPALKADAPAGDHHF
ncbi:hypothetical protein D3C77_521650 [compost metagenome]